MKSFETILKEITTTGSIPPTPVKQKLRKELPKDVIDAWKSSLEYDYKMKRKFSYYDVLNKTTKVSKGFKGHLTRSENKLKSVIDSHKMDLNKTVKELYNLYPPRYI